MAKILLLPSDEPNQDVLPVARMIGDLLAENEEQNTRNFPEQFVAALERETPDYYAILCLFGDEYDVLQAGCEAAQKEYQKVLDSAKEPKEMTKTQITAAQQAFANKARFEERLELFFSSLIYLLPQMSGVAKLEAAVERVVQLVTRDTLFASLRLRLLMIAYNSLPVVEKTAGMARKMFFTVIEYAKETQLFHELLPYVDCFDAWIDSWGLKELDDKKSLYYTIATELPRVGESHLKTCLEFGAGGLLGSGASIEAGGKTDNTAVASSISPHDELANKQIYKPLYWLTKYLFVETELNDRSKEAIKRYVGEVIREDVSAAFGVEAALKNSGLLSKARSGGDTGLKPLFELLDLFVSGDIDTLDKFLAKNPKLFSSTFDNTMEAELRRKIQLLTLCSVCAKGDPKNDGSRRPHLVAMGDLQKALKCRQLSEVDEVVIQAIHGGALEGRIDETTGMLKVTSVTQREFGTKEWKDLTTRLGIWIEKIEDYVKEKEKQ